MAGNLSFDGPEDKEIRELLQEGKHEEARLLLLKNLRETKASFARSFNERCEKVFGITVDKLIADPSIPFTLMGSSNILVRTMAVLFIADNYEKSDATLYLIYNMAINDESPHVRCNAVHAFSSWKRGPHNKLVFYMLHNILFNETEHPIVRECAYIDILGFNYGISYKPKRDKFNFHEDVDLDLVARILEEQSEAIR